MKPLANLRRVVAAVRRITDPSPGGFGISQRSVTVSTVGLASAIRKLADERMQVRLAVSLHTPDDELWNTLVPVNQRWPVVEVLGAARYYADTSGRRVSIEYALIRGLNDQLWQADLLARRLREHLGQLAHMNVIPLNPTCSAAARRPGHAAELAGRRAAQPRRGHRPRTWQEG